MTSTFELLLNGLDGSNPLAYLAALGVFRTLAQASPCGSVRFGWKRLSQWTPVIHSDQQLSEAVLVGFLVKQLTGLEVRPEFNSLGDDLSVGPTVFRSFAAEAAITAKREDRTAADYAASFGSEMCPSEAGVIQDTAFRTMAGAGHQHFLGTMRNVIKAASSDHFQKTLFSQWKYDDPMQNLSLRFDPNDDIRYALQWQNPSGDRNRTFSGSMTGANRLAIEAIPLFPTAIVNSKLVTVGFRGTRVSNTFWTWPVWSAPIELDSVRSLLSLKELQCDNPNRANLTAIGVNEVFRSQRLTIGKVRNFTPGKSV